MTGKLIATGIVATMAVAQGADAALTQLDSTAFTAATLDQIEGDVLPGTLGGWTDQGGDAISVLGGGGTFTQTNTASSDQRWLDGAAGFNNATGWTIEARLQITAAATAGEHVTQIIPRDGVTSTRLFIGAGGLGSDADNGNNNDVLAIDLTDTFHTIRLAMDGSSSQISLFVDGVLITDNYVTTASASNAVILGNSSGNISSGAVEYDYIRFDTTGGYAPVPEPGSLALLGLGGLAMLRRRRG